MTIVPGKPTIPDVAPFIEMYYRLPGNSVGGSLHIVLDDGNIDRSFVEYCKEYALEKQDYFGAALANILLRMSLTQRKKLSRKSWGPFAEPYQPGSGGSWLWA